MKIISRKLKQDLNLKIQQIKLFLHIKDQKGTSSYINKKIKDLRRSSSLFFRKKKMKLTNKFGTILASQKFFD